MKTYISDLVLNEEVTSFFMVVDVPQVRKNKRDQDYLCLKLTDKTGEVEARVWDVPPGLDVNSLGKSIVKVRGQVGSWNDQVQVTITQIRKVNGEDAIDMADFFERSERDPEDMYVDLRERLSIHLTNEYVASLLYKVLAENAQEFKKAPAAKSIHHNYLGGLLEHVLSLCDTCISLSTRYELDLDLMLAACVLHDIGKIRELSYSMGTSYTVEGTLIGHISIGMGMVDRAIRELDEVRDFPANLKMAIMHLIASHHGLLEWGSPRVPLMREAVAFHLADMLDSKMATCARILKAGVSDEGLSEWSKEMGGPLWRMPE